MGAGWCGGGGADGQNQGSVLDRVISGSSNKDECLLYKLADYKNGGELIEAYNIGGQAEVEKLIREQFGVLMYADGKGEVIKRAEYLRWKFRDQGQVVLPIEASLSIYDPLAKWEDHEACWQMQYRGSLGETLLHVLIICDTKVHTKLARTLLKCFPKLALDIVEGEEYLGASALHLAIAYSNNELVQDLVDAEANINQRAIGSFFLPKDQQRAKPSKTTDYEGLAYLGEYPLSWAACCSNESVYNLLLDKGADPDSQDSFGNMILHMVVVCDKLDMFGYALRHPKQPASNGILNNEGLTPLTLACKLGRAEVFKEMLELSAREFWRYSNITCSAYPLNALDTLLPDGRTNWNSAIFIILNGTKEEHLDMLDGGIIQRLLEEKWKTFARTQFMKRLAILFLHLVTLSGSIYMRPDDREKPLLGGTEFQDIARYCFEISTIIGVLCYLAFQQGDEIRNQGLISFLKQLPHDPAKFIFLISNLLILAAIPYRFLGEVPTEEAILVFAVPSSWFLLMFFAGAIRLTGPFVTMVYSMITGDMLTFGIIYMVMLFGFSQSFYFLYKGSKNVSNSLYNSYPSTWMALFQITMGDYSYGDLAYTTYPALSKMVFTIFMVLVPILLLNMLIAMMGNTYAHVIEQSEKEWMKQWAKIVVALERAVNQQDCHHYLQEYSIALGPGDEPGTEQRGVMVIKSKSKTRARQRKGAVANWKNITGTANAGMCAVGIIHGSYDVRGKFRILRSTRTQVKLGTSSYKISQSVEPIYIKKSNGSLLILTRVGKVTIRELHKRGMTGEQLRRIMWGRASISTPVRAPKAAKGLSDITDLTGVGDTSASDPFGGGGLMAALDIMAFADDVDIADNQPTIPTTATQKTDLKAEDLESQEIFMAEDPLRQLVIKSEGLDPADVGKSENEKQQEMLTLARAAANNEGIEEIPFRIFHFGWMSGFGFVDYSNMSGERCFEAVDQPVDLTTLDPSDSDGLGAEGPLLGRGSRLKRAKSAKSKSTEPSSPPSDQRLLIQDDSSSTHSEDLGIMNPAFSNGNGDSNGTVKTKSPKGRKRPQTGKTDRRAIRQRPRPKTANNRVAPMEVSMPQRGQSANSGLPQPQQTPSSPPDPLDPWSTKDITNMNTLLAWDNEDSM